MHYALRTNVSVNLNIYWDNDNNIIDWLWQCDRIWTTVLIKPIVFLYVTLYFLSNILGLEIAFHYSNIDIVNMSKTEK